MLKASDKMIKKTSQLITAGQVCSKKEKKSAVIASSLVEDDLDGIAWRSLYDPLAVKGLLVEFWPARGEDDPTGSLQIPSAWS